MPDEYILLAISDQNTAELLDRSALTPAGYRVTLVTDLQTLEALLKGSLPDLIILGDQLAGENTAEQAARLFSRYPQLPIILLPGQHSDSLAIKALRQGFTDYLQPPVRPHDVVQAVSRALERRQRWENWARLEGKRNTKSLQRRVSELEALQRVGRKVTALLDLDGVLTAVVDAAVELTGAEEGSLLLLDESTGELYIRAARNFQENFVRTFRLPIHDTLAGQVLRTGKPLLIDEKTPRKIKTAYLVYTIIYVPLIIHEQVIGVLEVDNRQSRQPFSEEHVAQVSALADYAAIAVENARLYSRTEVERKKLEAILTHLDEGVLIVDTDKRILLINPTARNTFGIQEPGLAGRRVNEVIFQPDLIEILLEDKRTVASRLEIALEDGRVLNTQVTPIPEVGLAVTMQDITHLKELDRIKSDFVSTVSHDLRSPLTAILGYAELIERVGPVNSQQKEFIRRVQFSVHNITALINDLLDLGRIEAGFDARKEIVPLTAIIRYAVDSLRSRIQEKDQTLLLEAPEDLPPLLGNPIRLRQMVSNLVGNAVKYTPEKGRILVRANAEGGQVIFQVTDNGPGIPPVDQPYIFDKFYRGSNLAQEVPGTGLGLAIVKSIVDNHQGRIWVNSNLGQGSTFTVVLPIADQNL